ncbi:MAG: hypothetical protein HIU85_18495, partial [Proteobacteria bacterium]|nr:hypothetical protein [Pseudomonadota bacterium]
MSDVKLPQKNVRRAVRMTLSAAIGLTPLALALPAQAGTIGTGTTTVTYSGSIVDYTVGTTGLYDITAYGANGGSSPFAAGGTGGEIGGEFNLSAGDALSILVGGAGVDYVSGNYSSVGGGGGGGTFVILGNSPLVVAGAGGGGGGGYGFA